MNENFLLVETKREAQVSGDCSITLNFPGAVGSSLGHDGPLISYVLGTL